MAPERAFIILSERHCFVTYITRVIPAQPMPITPWPRLAIQAWPIPPPLALDESNSDSESSTASSSPPLSAVNVVTDGEQEVDYDDDEEEEEGEEEGAFILFNRLPTEIRLRIWHCAAYMPRVIKLRGSTSPLLHACSASREVAQNTLQLCFEGNLRNPIYLNSDTDVLYLPVDELNRLLAIWQSPRPSFGQYAIKSLAINTGSRPWNGVDSNMVRVCLNAIRSFGTLEELSMITSRDDEHSFAHSARVMLGGIQDKYQREQDIWDRLLKQDVRCVRYVLPTKLTLENEATFIARVEGRDTNHEER